jgi:hypothetical protein
LTTQSYTNRTNRPTRKYPKEESALFYRRLRRTLTDLQKIQSQLPPEVWARFAAAYSRHWLYSLDHGEKAVAPGDYYNEWAEAQTNGAIPMAGNDDLHGARNYQVYESPRERARKALGLEGGPAPIGEGRAA